MNWFIPGRRAAMTETVSYHTLIDAWCDEIQRVANALSRWYALTEDDIETGLAAIHNWQASFFAEGGDIFVPRDGWTTIDSPTAHFKPRLWKGALRVLREALLGPDEPGETIFDPIETSDPRLLLSDRREIDNPDALLLMGDVVELPLWKFLGAAGKSVYGRPPDFEDVFTFNPNGSYLLGTSLADAGDDDPPLHDNITAMRFQVLLGCMVGSFCHHEPVIDHERAVSAAIAEPIAPPKPAEASSIDDLLVEVRRVYDPVSFSDRSLFKQQLKQSQDDAARWREVSKTTADRLEQWARKDWEGNPPPRAFLWRIKDRFETLAAKSHLDAGDEIEIAALTDLHDRVMARIQIWVAELDELLTSPLWREHQHIGPDFAALAGELEAARAISFPCPHLCRLEHARTEVSRLVKALREKLAALEKARTAPASGGGAPAGPAIYARGMIYAAVLYSAGYRSWYKEDPEAWHFYTNQWCRSSKGEIARCLPYPWSLDRLPRHQPVTPGSVCSDTTLLLLNYMIRNHGKAGVPTWGKGSVSASMRGSTHRAIHDYFEYWPDEEVAKLAPSTKREDRLARLDSLIGKVREVFRNVSREENYWTVFYRLAAGDARWRQVGPKTQESLARACGQMQAGYGPPHWFLKALSKGLKFNSGEAHDALVALHDNVIESTRKFGKLVDGLAVDEDWKAFDEVGLDPGKYADDRAFVAAIPAGGLVGRYDHDHELARKIGDAVWRIHKALASKRKALEKLAAKPDKIKDTVGGLRDMTDDLGDINSVAFSGHEWAIVRVHSFDQLLEETGLPGPGFISAFHPLSGRPYHDETCHPRGQFYVFEQREQLFRFTNPATGRRHVFLGAAPFVWKKVSGNEFHIYPAGGKVKFTEPGRSTNKRLVSITRLVARDKFLARQVEPPHARPLFIHPTTKPSSASLQAKRAVAYARMVSNGPALYASRALPFPTLEEARHAYASWDEADADLDRLGARR